MTKRAAWELVQDVDEDQYHGVMCPIEWCEAHNAASVNCGDHLGPFVGVHQGRINAKRTQTATTTRRLRALGLSADLAGWSEIMRSQANLGNVPGIVGPRLKAKRRARKRLGMAHDS